MQRPAGGRAGAVASTTYRAGGAVQTAARMPVLPAPQRVPRNPFHSRHPLHISALSLALGVVLGAGVCLVLWSDSWRLFGAFMVLFAVFHELEFACVAAYNPGELTTDCARGLPCSPAPGRRR